MKKNLLFLTLLLLPVLCGAQMVLDDFDTLVDTSRYNIYVGPAGTYLHPTLETTTVHDGAGAARLEWQNRCYDQWGGWIGITHDNPTVGVTYDFSMYTNVTFWYYNAVKQSKTNQVEYRLIFRENGPGTDEGAGNYEIWFSHHYILDNDPGWNKIDVKMEDVGVQSGTGFWNPGWGQAADGDGILQLDKIKGWTLEFSQSNGLYQQPDDSVSGVLIIDQLQLEGIAPVNLVFFNGKAVPATVNMHVGWSGALEIVDDVFYTEGASSIKWTCGSGWDGVDFDLAAPRNMLLNWHTDSVQFKIKADAGLGDLTLVFGDLDEDGAVKTDYSFQATYALTEAAMGYDGSWKQVKLPLRAFNRFAGVWDNDLGKNVDGEFDSTKVVRYYITGAGQAFDGKVVYLTDIWTGNPVFDWTAPAQVTGVGGAPGNFYNLVFWDEVPNEAGETYTIYASENPISDVSDPTLEIVASGVNETVHSVTHWIFYPQNDKNVTIYYAVTCSDASGNVGPAGLSPSVTNTGKGVPTIADQAPPNFAADGNLAEWAGIMPWVLTPEENNIAAGTVDNAADLTATIYVAMDADNLYVALDILDNSFNYDPGQVGSWWTQDAFEFFIGLWDQNGKPIHSANPWNNRGAEPDYKLIFLQDRYVNEYKNSSLGLGMTAEYTPGSENYYFEQFSGADWMLEAKIPFSAIAFGDDQVFTPVRGKRLMFDLVMHDYDGGTNRGNLTWSDKNRDTAYLYQNEWTFTWIGDTTHTATAIGDKTDVIVHEFSLKQNYPNPFNPTTTIAYSVASASHLSIEVFDLLGKKVATLMDGKQNPGVYEVTFDAHSLTSGVYFYKMQAGDFVQLRKMLVVK
jgi:hypothetical protein